MPRPGLMDRNSTGKASTRALMMVLALLRRHATVPMDGKATIATRQYAGIPISTATYVAARTAGSALGQTTASASSTNLCCLERIQKFDRPRQDGPAKTAPLPSVHRGTTTPNVRMYLLGLEVFLQVDRGATGVRTEGIARHQTYAPVHQTGPGSIVERQYVPSTRTREPSRI